MCIVVALEAEVMVGFEDGVEEVEGDDEDADAPAVRVEFGGAGGGFRVAGADGEGIPYRLRPAGYKLKAEKVSFSCLRPS